VFALKKLLLLGKIYLPFWILTRSPLAVAVIYIFVKIYGKKDEFLAEQTRKMEVEISNLITDTVVKSFQEVSPEWVVLAVGLIVLGLGLMIGLTIRGLLNILGKKIKPSEVKVNTKSNMLESEVV
jgi:hypothetical protein